MVALQIPIASRPLAIAFAAPGVQNAARVLFGHESRDGPIQTRRLLPVDGWFMDGSWMVHEVHV